MVDQDLDALRGSPGVRGGLGENLAGRSQRCDGTRLPGLGAYGDAQPEPVHQDIEGLLTRLLGDA